MGLDDMMHEKYSLTPMGRESQKLLVGTKKPTRWISKTPFKVLDAPELAVSNSSRERITDNADIRIFLSFLLTG